MQCRDIRDGTEEDDQGEDGDDDEDDGDEDTGGEQSSGLSYCCCPIPCRTDSIILMEREVVQKQVRLYTDFFCQLYYK